MIHGSGSDDSCALWTSRAANAIHAALLPAQAIPAAAVARRCRACRYTARGAIFGNAAHMGRFRRRRGTHPVPRPEYRRWPAGTVVEALRSLAGTADRRLP